MSESMVGIGFIGAGEISVLHDRALREIPSARLVGLFDIDSARATSRAQEYGCRCYETGEELIADPAVQAVFVLTNLETHGSYAQKAMEAGKHVLVEKPVGATTSEVVGLKSLAERTGRVCVPGHNMIHEPGLARARAMIRNGDIGKVVSCYVLYNIQHSEERAATLPGMIRHILTHNIYTMQYLVGNPKRITAMTSIRHYEKLQKEDLAMVLVELENGGIAHLCASFAADDLSSDPWSFLVKVIGTTGTTRYSYQDWVEVKKGISHSRTYTAYQATITNEDRHFLEVCLAGGEPLSSLDDAIVAQKTIEACERSIAEGITVAV
jgi:predicted dehydrogenase